MHGSTITSCMLLLASFAFASYSHHKRANTCTIPSTYKSSGGTADDSPAIASAFAKCSQDATIVFSEGADYNVLQPIKATNLSHVVIQMQGTLHLPQNITAIQAIVNKTTAATNASALYWY